MNILDEITSVKKYEVGILRRDYTYSRFSDSEFFNRKCLSIKDEIKKNKDISIIAEIKKASPSKGIINQDFDHIRIANIYFENDVNAVSVLTDKKFFQGNEIFLQDIAKFRNKPLLRKDFIIDEYQVIQSKSYGADVILLIAEILSPAQITEFSAAAHELGMEVLLELHSADELFKIDNSVNDLIGINNRDLKSFQTDIETTIKMRKLLKGDPLVVSESGINSSITVEILKDNGINAMLVGEFIMKSKNIKDTIQQLKEWCKL